MNYQSLKKNDKALQWAQSLKKNDQMLQWAQSLKKNDKTFQWAQSLKKNYLLRTVVIVFLSLFMLHSNIVIMNMRVHRKWKRKQVMCQLSYLPLPLTAWCSGRGQWACSFENCHFWHLVSLPGQSSGRWPYQLLNLISF